jgi:hypothetical protein
LLIACRLVQKQNRQGGGPFLCHAYSWCFCYACSVTISRHLCKDSLAGSLCWSESGIRIFFFVYNRTQLEGSPPATGYPQVFKKCCSATAYSYITTTIFFRIPQLLKKGCSVTAYPHLHFGNRLWKVRSQKINLSVQ